MQLCRQVERAVSFALSNASSDVLRDLYVQSVKPAPNASHFLVVVSSMDNEADALLVVQELEKARGYLRCEVAASIHRRKTPQLSFQHVQSTNKNATG